MKTNLLFPHRYKKIGIIIILLGIILLFIPGSLYNTYTIKIPWLEEEIFFPEKVNIHYTLVTAFFIIGGIFTGFSKEK